MYVFDIFYVLSLCLNVLSLYLYLISLSFSFLPSLRGVERERKMKENKSKGNKKVNSSTSLSFLFKILIVPWVLLVI